MNDCYNDPPEPEEDPIEIAFDTWWEQEGSAMRPEQGEDLEEFAERVTRIAWMDGAFKACELEKECREQADALAEFERDQEPCMPIENTCRACGKPTDCLYCSEECAPDCVHGNRPGDCDACDHLSDLAHDAAREGGAR